MPHDPQAFPDDCHPGMALRDYFAAAALPALFGARTSDQDGPMSLLYWGDNGLGFNARGLAADLAKIAYEVADAMLQARTPKES